MCGNRIGAIGPPGLEERIACPEHYLLDPPVDQAVDPVQRARSPGQAAPISLDQVNLPANQAQDGDSDRDSGLAIIILVENPGIARFPGQRVALRVL